MSEILKAENVHRSYQDGRHNLHVLKGIDITISKGEIAMILGPSGSGKSTLLHILGILDKPTKGTVFLNGVSVYKADDAFSGKLRNENIGFVFQFYHLLPEFNAVENVMMPALVRKLSLGFARDENRNLIRERARGLLDEVGLGNRMRHRPSQLSGGEAQRVAIARALMNEPEIVLCDEPTGNLDRDNALNIFELIKKLNSRYNKAFVIVTHDNEHTKYATSVKYLTDGKIKAA
ncbi:MAG: ABC transporter ATP-binding protein [Candidatus Omnitrophica bacterium]|nr:ABC transporter ATP-binding protein [Candidatus Omnitrophota bacterium]